MYDISILEVGFKFPSLEKVIYLTNMVTYAGATWDWHQMHYDLDYVESIGLDKPVVDGQMLGAYLADHVISTLGDNTFIEEMEYQFKNPVYSGDRVIFNAHITSINTAALKTAVEVSHSVTVGSNKVLDGAVTRATIRNSEYLYPEA